MVLEAGIDIDVATLKLIGTRGCLIALVGSLLPIGIGIGLAYAVGVTDAREAIAAGATFGPTSLGIALNILRSGGVLNTPVGQLIVSAAVIDDMIALIVLSQLEALVGTITVAGILIPVVSALLFLIVGGAIALFVLPPFLDRFLWSRWNLESKGKIELGIMLGILLGLMPATFYAKASYLMGAFVAGLGFCTSHELHAEFVRQFKRVLQWLMRIFFAASIGFQVPILDFGNGEVIWKGLVFTIALVGKLAVGFMVPNFTQSKRFTKFHLRDCLITGFSMAAEGEFAFVIAVFSVDNGLISKDLYASVVLAVLLSTIIPPFLLRFTIGYYNKKAEETVRRLADEELERNHKLDGGEALTETEREEQLVNSIQSQRAVFMCIQTQSMAKWGLLHRMIDTVSKLGLDIIDHRSWHPRGINTTLLTEVYVRDHIDFQHKGELQEVLDARMEEIRLALEKEINQPDDSRVKVQRWYPGVVEEIVENVHEKSKVTEAKKLNLEDRLVREASERMSRKQEIQKSATKEKTVDEILAGMQSEPTLPSVEEGQPLRLQEQKAPKQARRRRQKMRSTPVVGGGLFEETPSVAQEEKTPDVGSAAAAKDKWRADFMLPKRGHRAEIIVDGVSYDVRVNDATLRALRTGFSGDMLDTHGVMSGGLGIEPGESTIVNRLQGYVRSGAPMSAITEEPESESETSSVHQLNYQDFDQRNGNGDSPV